MKRCAAKSDILRAIFFTYGMAKWVIDARARAMRAFKSTSSTRLWTSQKIQMVVGVGIHRNTKCMTTSVDIFHHGVKTDRAGKRHSRDHYARGSTDKFPAYEKAVRD